MKSKKFIPLLVVPLLLIACSGAIPSEDSTDITSNDPMTSETPTEVPSSSEQPSEPSSESTSSPVNPVPTGLRVKQLVTDFICVEPVNMDASFEVKVEMSDGTVRDVQYDPTRLNGWYTKDLWSRGYGHVPEINHRYPVYDVITGQIAYLGIEETFPVTFNMRGGTMVADAKPELVDCYPEKLMYGLGETIDFDDLVISTNFVDYGGPDLLYPGDGQDGYLMTCDTIEDLSKPLDTLGYHTITFSYRGQKNTIELQVIEESNRRLTQFNCYDLAVYDFFTNTNMESTGSPKMLIVPVWFTDSSDFVDPNKKDQMRKDIQTIYLGTEEETGWHSVKSYYREDSYGQLDLQGHVTDWYIDNHPSTYYDEETQNVTTNGLIEKISAWAKSFLSKEEYLSLDANKDGFLDAVVAIYAADDYRKQIADGRVTEEEANQNLWAYAFTLNNPDVDPNPEDPSPRAFFWASYDFMYRKQNNPASPVKLDAHCFIHELGHVMGLNDYYDYSRINYPAGGFSMEDINCGTHDPYSKLAYGWCNPYVADKTQTFTLKPFVTSGDMLMLIPEYHMNPYDEYILLEYFTPTGLNELDCTYAYDKRFPAGPNESGLRVWHVDSRLQNYRLDLVGNTFEYVAYEDDFLQGQPDFTSGVIGVQPVMTNTTHVDGGYEPRNYESYYDYDELALLNHSKPGSEKYPFATYFTADFLWQAGDKFDMNTYSGQFPKGNKLDSGLELGYTFEVISQNAEGITVSVTKL